MGSMCFLGEQLSSALFVGKNHTYTDTPAGPARGCINVSFCHLSEPRCLQAQRTHEEAVGTLGGKGGESSEGRDRDTSCVVTNTETFSAVFMALFALSKSLGLL